MRATAPIPGAVVSRCTCGWKMEPVTDVLRALSNEILHMMWSDDAKQSQA